MDWFKTRVDNIRGTEMAAILREALREDSEMNTVVVAWISSGTVAEERDPWALGLDSPVVSDGRQMQLILPIS